MTMLGAFTGFLVEDAGLVWFEVLNHRVLRSLAIASYGGPVETGARLVAQVAE